MTRILLSFMIALTIGTTFPDVVRGQSGEITNSGLVSRLDSLPRDYAPRESAKVDLIALCASYPGLCLDFKFRDGQLFLQIAGGILLPYDDGRKKTLEQKLAEPDIEDMFSAVYPLGSMEPPLDPDFDPGRVRVHPVFDAVYGRTAETIRKRLVKVNFCGQSVMFHGSEGAATALEAVSRELVDLLSKNAVLSDFILPLGGTFNYRLIAGTRQLSPHSYGIAIDLNPRKGAYWRSSPKWQPDKLAHSRRDYPPEIVRIFERHGFIWGGKWGHYDLMHFEYRPEILLKTKMLAPKGVERP